MAARIDVRVMPRAPRDAIDGMRGERLLVRVTAPPVEGAANAAVVAVIAAALDVPRGSVRVVSGNTGRNKVVEIAGLDDAEARRRLSAILG